VDASRASAPAADRLIVALDVPALADAERLVRLLRPAVTWFKVGSELFTAAGPAAAAMVHHHGGRVFLDLKFHDIPHTVAGAVAAAARIGVAMVNVHVAGGEAMLREAAAAARAAASRPLLVGVTVLTSAADGGGPARAVKMSRVAQHCGLDGVVASALEAPAIKAACGEAFVVVAPGIRLEALPADDQRRTAGPAEAVRLGADFLVVGRPIAQAPDPPAAARRVLLEIEHAL